MNLRSVAFHTIKLWNSNFLIFIRWNFWQFGIFFFSTNFIIFLIFFFNFFFFFFLFNFSSTTCTNCYGGGRPICSKTLSGSTSFVCPDGYDCILYCSGTSRCQSDTIVCQPSLGGYCNLGCYGGSACRSAAFYCNGTSSSITTLPSCSLYCDSTSNSCRSVTMACRGVSCFFLQSENSEIFLFFFQSRILPHAA